MGAVSEHLLAAEVLLLHGPHALLIEELLLGHLGLTHLHLALVHDVSLLLGIHTLEVVGLDAVGGEHRLLRGGVLSHEVMVVSMINISSSLELLVCALRNITIPLLLRELHVSVLNRLLHVNAMLRVLVLRVSQELVEVQLLLVVHVLRESRLLRKELSLSDLLVDPVLLL